MWVESWYTHREDMGVRGYNSIVRVWCGVVWEPEGDEGGTAPHQTITVRESTHRCVMERWGMPITTADIYDFIVNGNGAASCTLFGTRHMVKLTFSWRAASFQKIGLHIDQFLVEVVRVMPRKLVVISITVNVGMSQPANAISHPLIILLPFIWLHSFSSQECFTAETK